MDLAFMSVDELKLSRRRIKRELKTRHQNFRLTVEMVSNREFVVRANEISRKAIEVCDEFEIYGYGEAVYYRHNKMGFRYEDDRDANDCRYHLDQVTSSLKKCCY